MLFIVIMGFSGGLFAQVASPMYSITRGAGQAYTMCDSMILLGAGDFVAVDTIPLISSPGAVKRDSVKYRLGAFLCETCDSMILIKAPINIEYGKWASFENTQSGKSIPPHQIKVIPQNALEFNTNAIPLKLGLMFLSGAADGMTQVIAFHPDRFFERHPNANRQFWDNSISWRNKYKNGDPSQGRAFPFSRSVLAWTTDAFHLFRTGSRLTAVAGLTIPLYRGSGKKLRHYAAEIGLSGLAWSAGFHATYTLLY